MEIVVFSLAGIIIGLTLGYVVFVLLRRKQLETERGSLIEEAKLQAENIKKDRILEAKEKYMSLKSEHEKEVNRRNQEMSNAENRIRQKEQSWDQKLQQVKQKEDDLTKSRETLDAQMEGLKNKQRDVEAMREQQLLQLEKMAGLSSL